MDLSTTSVMAAKAYSYKAESLVKEYLLADAYVSYTAMLGGILMCKMVLFAPLLFVDIYDHVTCEFSDAHMIHLFRWKKQIDVSFTFLLNFTM